MGRAMIGGIVLVAIVFGLGGWVYAGDGPAEPAERLALARILIKAGSYDEAAAICKEPAVAALGIDVRKCLVSAYIGAGKDAEADAEFQKMLSACADDRGLADAIVDAANAYLKSKQPARAKALYLLAKEKGAGTDAVARAITGLTRVSIEEGDATAVKDYIDKLTRDYAGKNVLADALRSIALHYWQRDMKSEAAGTLESGAAVLQGVPRLKVLARLSYFLISDGDPRAEAIIETMKEEAKGSADGVLCLVEPAVNQLRRKKAAADGRLFKWIRDEAAASGAGGPELAEVQMYCELCDILEAVAAGPGDWPARAESFRSAYAGQAEMPDSLIRIGYVCWTKGRAAKDDATMRQARDIFAIVAAKYPSVPKATTAREMMAKVDMALTGEVAAAEKLTDSDRLRVAAAAVCMAIANGDAKKAESLIETIKDETRGQPEAALCLMPVASKYLDRGDVSKAAGLFGWIREQQGPGIPQEGSEAAKAVFYMDLCDMMLDLKGGRGDIGASEAFCERYAGWSELPDAVLMITGEYLAKYKRMDRDSLPDANDRFLNRSMELLEAYVVVKSESRTRRASGYNLVGGIRETLGEYASAAAAYQQALEVDPGSNEGYIYLLGAARCYEALLIKGIMTLETAESAMRKCFQQILTKYPACPESIRQAIEIWLNKHSE